MSPDARTESAERHARSETRLDHLDSLTGVLFQKLEELPSKIGTIIDEKMKHHEELDRQRAAQYAANVQEFRFALKSMEDRTKVVENWKQKIENYYTVIILFVSGVAAVLSLIIKSIF